MSVSSTAVMTLQLNLLWNPGLASFVPKYRWWCASAVSGDAGGGVMTISVVSPGNITEDLYVILDRAMLQPGTIPTGVTLDGNLGSVEGPPYQQNIPMLSGSIAAGQSSSVCFESANPIYLGRIAVSNNQIFQANLGANGAGTTARLILQGRIFSGMPAGN